MNIARRYLTRCLTTTTNTHIVPLPADQPPIRDQLRALLRETAQPVAVITSILRPENPSDAPSPYHGATLSSFTSIALDPFPLVTFSLRLPSRMATSIKSAPPHAHSHMVINVLSAAQSSTAIAFSRPDLHQEPFTAVPYFLSQDGIPILEGSLGAVSCKLVSRSLPLHDLDLLERGFWTDEDGALMGSMKASELFIARVVRVEDTHERDDRKSEGPWTLPLLYHRRYFTSCDINTQYGGSTPYSTR